MLIKSSSAYVLGYILSYLEKFPRVGMGSMAFYGLVDIVQVLFNQGEDYEGLEKEILDDIALAFVAISMFQFLMEDLLIRSQLGMRIESLIKKCQKSALDTSYFQRVSKFLDGFYAVRNAPPIGGSVEQSIVTDKHDCVYYSGAIFSWMDKVPRVSIGSMALYGLCNMSEVFLSPPNDDNDDDASQHAKFSLETRKLFAYVMCAVLFFSLSQFVIEDVLVRLGVFKNPNGLVAGICDGRNAPKKPKDVIYEGDKNQVTLAYRVGFGLNYIDKVPRVSIGSMALFAFYNILQRKFNDGKPFDFLSNQSAAFITLGVLALSFMLFVIEDILMRCGLGRQGDGFFKNFCDGMSKSRNAPERKPMAYRSF